MIKHMTLTATAIQACVVLSNAIEDLAEDVELNFSDGLPDTRNDLCVAYDHLCGALSHELGIDAHEMIQGIINAKLNAERAILTAATGISFPEAGA